MEIAGSADAVIVLATVATVVPSPATHTSNVAVSAGLTLMLKLEIVHPVGVDPYATVPADNAPAPVTNVAKRSPVIVPVGPCGPGGPICPFQTFMVPAVSTEKATVLVLRVFRASK